MQININYASYYNRTSLTSNRNAIKGEGILILDGLRHCCLEVQDNISYIANDARFSKGSLLQLIFRTKLENSKYIKNRYEKIYKKFKI